MNETSRRLVLTPEALLPLGAVLVVVTTVAGAAYWVASTLGDLRHTVENVAIEMRHKIDITTSSLDNIKASQDKQIDRNEFALWVELLRAQNPDRLKVPELPK